MGAIIKGADISTYITTGLTMCQAKKENRNGIKSKFLILLAKDEESGIAKPTRIPLFEEDLPAGIFEKLSPFRLQDKDGKPVQDAKGGYPVDMTALKAAMPSDDGLSEMISPYLRLPGGMIEDYDMGADYYANDVDGKRTKDGRGNDVIKRTISVFVQVKHYLPTADGGLKPVYFAGFGLNERGSRMKAQFYREAVNKVVAPSEEAGEKASESDPF